jgi:uncharacterized protein (TIGR03086 family)
MFKPGATPRFYGSTMDAHDTEALLQPVLDDLAGVVAAIEPSQLSGPTPCSERDVATLRSHTIGWLDAFATGFADPAGHAPLEHSEDFAVADAGAAVRAAAARLDAAIAAGAGERPLFIGANSMPGDMSLSMILWEYVVHGWDLARATGQNWSPDAAAVEAALEFAPGMLTPDFQGEGKAFGPPVPVSPDAAPLDRLLGLSGRDPSWTAPA